MVFFFLSLLIYFSFAHTFPPPHTVNIYTDIYLLLSVAFILPFFLPFFLPLFLLEREIDFDWKRLIGAVLPLRSLGT